MMHFPTATVSAAKLGLTPLIMLNAAIVANDVLNLLRTLAKGFLNGEAVVEWHIRRQHTPKRVLNFIR